MRRELGDVVTFDGELVHVAALARRESADGDAVRRTSQYPRPPSRTPPTRARDPRRASVVAIPDVLEDRDYARRRHGRRWRVSAACSRCRCCARASAIGAITVGRPKPGLFPDSQVALLQTFADQAVIAIENVRLFTELEARNRDVTEALEQQTATSDILRVISQSPTDVQPVFDAIAAARR